MKIFDNIEFIDLAIYTNKTLIFTDFHIGYEEALNKQGLLVPRFQFPEIIRRLGNIFKRLKNKKIEKIIINGDLKHEFGTISEQEWRHTLKLLDYFEQCCKEIILLKGNHDAILGPIAKKRNIRVLEHYLISPITKKTIKNNNKKMKIKNKIEKLLNDKNKKINGNKILIVHGNKLPDQKLIKDVDTIIIGHEHPAVSIKEGSRAELFKAYLVGKWRGKNLIVQPSFNLVTEGTDVLKEEVLSPFLKSNSGNFDAVVVGDKLYGFGKVEEL